MKKPGPGLGEKFKEIAVEIFIIVFAVTLSIWLHNWADHRHEQKETEEFLKGLSSDLKKDIQLLEENRNGISRLDSNFTFLRGLYETKKLDTASDRLINGHLYFELHATHANVGRYEGFKSSGKIGAIENDSLKQKILVYYQQTIPSLGDIEELVSSFQIKLLDLTVDRPDSSLRNLIKTIKSQSLLQYTVLNMSGNIEDYTDAIQQARTIIKMIEQ